MTEKKKQHVIPNCYLKAWCDPTTPAGQTPYIWRVTRDGRSKKKKAPEKSFTATDRYTITVPSGERNLIVEDTLAGLENAFVSVREKIQRRDALNSHDRITLCLFTAAMHSRTIRAGNHWQETARQIHDMVSSLEQQHNAEPKTSLLTGRMVETAPQALVMMSLEIQTPMYFEMEMSILVTTDEIGFITSDCPCVWFNPKAHTFPPFLRSPGLGQTDIEVTLPLTPHHLLFISHRKCPFYLDAAQNAVDKANRLSRAFSSDEFVSWTGETRSYWFRSGERPADAWENTEAGKKTMQRQVEWDEELKRKT